MLLVVHLIMQVWWRVIGLTLAGVSCDVEIASEFSLSQICYPSNTADYPSQSGETADTLAALV